jgi:hypothetical protein
LSEEHKVVDLAYFREMLRQEEAEINRIKDLGLFLFGEDEYQYA